MHFQNVKIEKKNSGGGITGRIGGKSSFNASGDNLPGMVGGKAWHNADGAAAPAAATPAATPAMSMSSFSWLWPFAAGIVITLLYKHFTKKSS